MIKQTNKTYNVITKEIEHTERIYNIEAKSKADAEEKVIAGVVEWDHTDIKKASIKIKKVIKK